VGSSPEGGIKFFILCNPSNHIVALGLTQPLRGILLRDKTRPARKADNLAAIF
jgi:hypothetical protein